MQPWPQDSTARQDAYNGLLRKVAAAAPGPGLRAGPELLRLPGATTPRISTASRCARATAATSTCSPGRRRLPGAGDPPLLGGPRPPAGGAHQRSERPERITPPVLRSAVAAPDPRSVGRGHAARRGRRRLEEAGGRSGDARAGCARRRPPRAAAARWASSSSCDSQHSKKRNVLGASRSSPQKYSRQPASRRLASVTSARLARTSSRSEGSKLSEPAMMIMRGG